MTDTTDIVERLRGNHYDKTKALMQRDCRQAADTIESLRAQVAELQKDAKRYRWLREQHWHDSPLAVVRKPKVAVKLGHTCPFRTLLDSDIDSAMKD